MRKILALALAMIMVLGLATSAFATSAEPQYNITVKDTEDAKSHTYFAYRIFKGTYANDKLGDLAWDDSIPTDVRTQILNDWEVTDFAGMLAKLSDSNAAQFAKVVASAMAAYDEAHSDSPIPCKELHVGNNAVEAGYYLVTEKGSVSGHHAQTAYILHVAGNVTLNPKSSVPTVDKQQATEDHPDFTDSPLDTYIGATVTYKLIGTMPATLNTYDTYWYEFIDTLSKGLTADKTSVVVTVDGTVVPAVYTLDGADEPVEHKNYEVTLTENTDETSTLKVVFGDVKNVVDEAGNPVTVTETSTVVVTYNAVLNSDAVVGNPGNPNKVKLEFSNDPNNSGDGTNKPEVGETPEDIVFVYTYTVDADKIDKNNQTVTLSGAEFQLQRVSDGKWYNLDAETNEITWTEYDKTAPVSEQNVMPTVVVSDADGKFGFTGLDAGEYKLWEIKAPAGYNTPANPFVIVIEATLDSTAKENHLTSLDVTVDGAKEEGDIATGTVDIQVRNTTGNSLPSTGGMGTTLFYILGAAMVLGAGVMLITKKRMGE